MTSTDQVRDAFVERLFASALGTMDVFTGLAGRPPWPLLHAGRARAACGRHGRQLTPRSKRSGERSRYAATEEARLRSNLRTRLSEASTSRNLHLHRRKDAECDQDER